MVRVVAWEEPTPAALGRARTLQRARSVPSLLSTRSWRSGSSDRPQPVIRPREKVNSLPALLRRLDEIWQGLQVSRRGAYSGVRMQYLHRYEAKTRLWRVLLVLLVTPLPSLAFVLVLNCLPIQSPDRGWRHNTTFWISLAIKMFVISQSFIEQLKQVIPELPITVRQTLAVSLLTTTVSSAIMVLVAACWVFPVPFSVVWSGPIFVALTLLFVGLVIGEQARSRLPKLRLRARVYAHILAVQGLLVVAYPAYNAIFVGLSDVQQTFFVVMPSIMKFGLKNWLCDACAPLPLHDELPEMLVFTVDLFNAIYLTACMQTDGSSMLTAFVIFLLGTVQLMMAVRTLLQRGRNIRSLLRQLRLESLRQASTQTTRGTFGFPGAPTSTAQNIPGDQLTAICIRMCFQNGHRTSVTRTAITGIDDIKEIFSQAGLLQQLASHTAHGRKAAIVVPGQLFTISPNVVSAQAQERLVHQILKTLFTCEYLILAEYVKCVIPLVSVIYTVVLYHLPAKAYFESMKQYATAAQVEQATQKVLLFLALQVLAFAVLAVVLRRQLRHSVVLHLGFVLERNAVMIQMRLLTWVTLAFLLPMTHTGVDYTFQFKWMKHGYS